MLLTLLQSVGAGGPISGNFVATEGSDAFVSSGIVRVSGNFVVSESADILSAEGVVRVRGNFVSTESQDTFTATGDALFITINGTRALRLLQIYRLHGLDMSNPLVVNDTSRTSGDLVQSISESSGTVVMSRTSAPTVFSGDLNEMIDALALIHGITDDLTVTSVSRVAGTVQQTISEAGNVITVTRTQ